MKLKKFGSKTIDSVRGIIKKNLPLIKKEIEETKELSELLLKWSKEGKLTKSEMKKVKDQLFDILKAIPALAILIIPFGTLILYLLIKMLPFNILPSAFLENSEDAPDIK